MRYSTFNYKVGLVLDDFAKLEAYVSVLNMLKKARPNLVA